MEKNTILEEVISAFALPSPPAEVSRCGTGHINETYVLSCPLPGERRKRFVLQGLSKEAFPKPDELMENFIGITSHLRRKIEAAGGDVNRETLNLVYTRDGKPYDTDAAGKVWRMTDFIEGTVCLQKATPELFEASARAFGHFQWLLQDYPAQTLHETIVKFHDTEDRFAKFLAVLKEDPLGRGEGVQPEIRFLMDRRADCSVAVTALREGKLPLRVTHNDTKLNNVLFDEVTMEGICILDLDTTMPGLCMYDFGDSIRFGANHCAEDEKDLSQAKLDLDLYTRFTRGFLNGLNGGLTQAELEYLPWGARLMTMENGIRFLTDYLDGDHYFHIDYPDQNLARARTQFALLADMEEKWDEMNRIVMEIAAR